MITMHRRFHLDLARFKAEYGTTRDGILAKRFWLTIRQVRSLARREALGKDRRLFPDAGWRLWSKADLRYLHAHYGKKTNRAIGVHLRRTARAVLNRAIREGLEKTSDHRSKVCRDNRIGCRKGQTRIPTSG